jgi:capsule polysaccharide export protein KpsE/RkpR
MASLKEAAELTERLEGLVGQVREELQSGEVDFEKLVALSDQISEQADGMAETFSSVNEALMQQIQQVRNGGSGGSSKRQGSKSASKAASGS